MELVVVFTILAVAAVVVAPSIIGSPPGDRGAPQASDQLDRLAKRARSLAVRHGEVSRLTVRADGVYEIRRTANGGSISIDSGRWRDEPLHVWTRAAVFEFAPNGAARPDTVRLAAGSATWLFTVDPWTGAGRVERSD